ncbi:MAG: DUF2939 domain-containing protein [Alphaproteobacteria bacterium]|nr:DUF2939 domain-containing protein [Alphaproteobacteria bacterium]MBU2378721.1 DUF2939 domain-containing protein [Alphaproteobacteria bacterium]
MKTILGRLVLAAIALAVIAFFAAPAVAFFGVRSAAQSDDIVGLQRLIDFDAVRASLRPQLSNRPEAMAPPPSFLNDPIGAVRRQFEDAAAPQGPNPDAYLTPDAIDGLTRAEGRYAAVRVARPGTDEASAPWPKPVYWSVNRARMAVTDEGGSDTVFTFERRGAFEWKLVHIGLPEGATPVAAPASAPPAAAPSEAKR